MLQKLGAGQPAPFFFQNREEGKSNMHASISNATPARLTTYMVLVQIAAAVGLWSMAPESLLPKPWEIWNAWLKLMSEGFLVDIGTSLLLTAEAVAITIVVSLGLAYLSVVPKFAHYVRPTVVLVTKLRFNSLVGLSFALMLVFKGHELKLWLLVFGMAVWLVTSMLAVIKDIPKEEYDLARTLGMSEWQVWSEVVMRGTADQALEVIRQNVAMGWMMLTMVEGLVHSEGGMGVMLIDNNKYLHLDAVFAIQITVVVIGVALDLLLELFKDMVCPYAKLGKE